MNQYRKALVAIAGLLAQIVAAGFVTGPLAHQVAVVLAVLTALGVHQVPNGTSGDAAP